MTVTRPNFLVAGAARSGTTALCRALASHPDVFMTDPKEMHFYAHAGTDTRYGGIDDDFLMNRHVVTEPDAFYRLFDGSAGYARRGDGSVSTLFRPDVAVPNIRRYAEPGTKVLVILREPVERAYSSYLYLRGRGHEPLTQFSAALAAEDDRARDNYHHMWLYARASEYRRQLEPFVEAFGDDLMIVLHEELEAARDVVLDDVCRFLDIERIALGGAEPVNRGGQPRSSQLPRLLNAARRYPPLLALGKAVVPRRWIESLKQANLERPPLDADVRESLAARFAADTRYVETLVGPERLSRWRRDERR